MIFPWHMLVPSVAVAGHWYLAAGPSKPFNDVFEVVRNVTGMDRGLPQECWKDNEAACKQSHYDDSWLNLVESGTVFCTGEKLKSKPTSQFLDLTTLRYPKLWCSNVIHIPNFVFNHLPGFDGRIDGPHSNQADGL